MLVHLFGTQRHSIDRRAPVARHQLAARVQRRQRLLDNLRQV
jgi:hypothetical protein